MSRMQQKKGFGGKWKRTHPAFQITSECRNTSKKPTILALSGQEEVAAELFIKYSGKEQKKHG